MWVFSYLLKLYTPSRLRYARFSSNIPLSVISVRLLPIRTISISIWPFLFETCHSTYSYEQTGLLRPNPGTTSQFDTYQGTRLIYGGVFNFPRVLITHAGQCHKQIRVIYMDQAWLYIRGYELGWWYQSWYHGVESPCEKTSGGEPTTYVHMKVDTSEDRPECNKTLYPSDISSSWLLIHSLAVNLIGRSHSHRLVLVQRLDRPQTYRFLGYCARRFCRRKLLGSIPLWPEAVNWWENEAVRR